MSIYISQQKKKELEAKIAELEKLKILVSKAAHTDPNFDLMQNITYAKYQKEIDVHKEILSSAIILPVEESWELICNSSFVGNINSVTINNFDTTYSQGVIIQPKQ